MNKNNDLIYQTLKNEIMLGKLKPGSAIIETEVSQRFGVSRTPIRQVFLKLSEEGFIDIIPQKGTFISLIDLKYIEDVVFMRLSVETVIMKAVMDKISEQDINFLQYNLTKQKSLINFSNNDHEMILEFNQLDNEFHHKIFEIADRVNLWNIINKLSSHYMRFRILDIFDKEILRELYAQHQSLLELIIQKNKETVGIQIEKHLKGGLSRINQVQNEYHQYIK